jgi:hypothetical protein
MTVSDCGYYYTCQTASQHSKRDLPRLPISLCHGQFLRRIEKLTAERSVLENDALRACAENLRRCGEDTRTSLIGNRPTMLPDHQGNEDQLRATRLSLLAEAKDILDDCVVAWKLGRDPERRILATLVGLMTQGIHYPRQGCVSLGIDLRRPR